MPEIAITHPLDPLSPQELIAACVAVRSHAGCDLRFQGVEVLEPSKALVRAWQPGSALARSARVTAFKRGELGAYKAEVDLAMGKVVKWEEVPNARPMIGMEDFGPCWKAVSTHEGLIKALDARSLKPDPKFLHIEPWPIGHVDGLPMELIDGKAPLQLFFWARNFPGDNHYAHPVEGLSAIFDRVSGSVLEMYDEGAVPIPTAAQNYHAKHNEERFGSYEFKPLAITQPEGVSFTLDNRLLKWHKWQVHIGFSFREGLILGDMRFAGRPVCYQATIAEMVVPYGAPKGVHSRKNVFDIGEAGFGLNANELQLGCDCKGSIQYLDAWISNSDGTARCIKNAVCIHEEDHGILWKHTDHMNPPEVRRARRLVISSVHTVGNYEYGCYWYFHMNGVIEFEMKATGIINTVSRTASGSPQDDSKFGTEVAPGVFGQVHQHLFTARLDLAIDGDANTVVECNTERDPMGSPGNPHGNSFYIAETILASEKQAARTKNDASARYWKFANPNKHNAMGRPTAYKLHPTHSLAPFAWPESATGQRMASYYKDLWVTAYDREHRYPSGEFMHQSSGKEDGLPVWTEGDRPIENTDIVIWHNFGLHHPVRPEDWPVQPCVTTGFRLEPTGFFDENPTLDVPPDTDRHSANARRDGA